MKPLRPYLLRALYEWIVDSGMTPYILVDAEREEVRVPRHYVQEGKIVLNISPVAVRGLQIEDDLLSFEARFGGSPYFVEVPPQAVLAIYAKETGRGMVFDEEEPEPPEPPKEKRPKGAPYLKVVK